MRISDWSSDVCSSDLNAEVRCCNVAQPFALARQQGAGALGREEGAHHAHREHHQGQQHQHFGRVVKEEFDRRSKITAGGDRQLRYQPPRKGQQLVVDDKPRGRSEEHTSELKSLMRISYAVFCSKNKKKTRDNRKHTTKQK